MKLDAKPFADAMEAVEKLLASADEHPFWFIQANSCLEAGLIALLTSRLKNGSHLDFSSISTRLVIDLSVAVGILEPNEAICFHKLNKIRNSLAHSVNPTFEIQIRELKNSLDGRVLMLFTHFSKNSRLSETQLILHSMNQMVLKSVFKDGSGWQGFERQLGQLEAKKLKKRQTCR